MDRVHNEYYFHWNSDHSLFFCYWLIKKNAWCGTLTTFQLLSNKKDAVGSLQKRNNQTNDKQIFSIIFDLI